MPAPGVVEVEPVNVQPVVVPPRAANVAETGPEPPSDTLERTRNKPAVTPP